MSELEFKFASDQEHQLEAINAVCDLFEGQQFRRGKFMTDTTSQSQTAIGLDSYSMDGGYSVGYSNDMLPSQQQLLKNLHSIQERNCLDPTDDRSAGNLRDFTVEMETGTGKTYVYIRTIYELHKRYGLTKFVIVVPSVAIREGVLKSFLTMKRHFDTLYDSTPLDYFVYNSEDMGRVGNFATSSSLQIMIINIDSFNKKSVNNFHEPSEKLPGGLSAQETVSACRPIVIIDEPQSVDNTDTAKSAIASLNPLFVLRYSATHKQKLNMVYRLTPVDAYQRGLVKTITVDSVLTEEDLNGAYIRLKSVSSDPYRAKLEIDVRQKDGSQKRSNITFAQDDSVYLKSKENSDYEDGWIISNINTQEGSECVEFSNGEVLKLGEAIGDPNAKHIKRAQILRTIEDHLERQYWVWPHGIKVLSLFFIDKVAKYRIYDSEPKPGEYAVWFEKCYTDVINSKAPARVLEDANLVTGTWAECYNKRGVPLITDASRVHQGYFAQDKSSGKFKDSTASAKTSNDIDAFALIMKDKERLISFPDGKDAGKDVSFIFSHSALKEGWDNPNVFQICTLVETKDTLTKRQKIGRGLRLAVDQNGNRVFDSNVNNLTVIANESYADFSKGLQSEFEAEGTHFGVLPYGAFSNIILSNVQGEEESLGYERSRKIVEQLKADQLVTKTGQITADLKKQAEESAINLPFEIDSVTKEVICDVILHRADSLKIHNKKQEVIVRVNENVIENEAFKALWDQIRQKTRYEVNIDSEKLVRLATAGIRSMARIEPPQIISERADLDINESGVASEAKESSLVQVDRLESYELPDPIAELQDSVGLTRKTLYQILSNCGRLNEFKNDPQAFLTQVREKIIEAKNRVLQDDGIKYVKLSEDEWYTMQDLRIDSYVAYLPDENDEHGNAWFSENKKSLYDYVVYDSKNVERNYAQALDRQSEVPVYVKLPSVFTIDTPLGSYNPDWAYVEDCNGDKRVYFVMETKGGENGKPALRDTERAKIAYAKKHFDLIFNYADDKIYDVRTTYVPGKANPMFHQS